MKILVTGGCGFIGSAVIRNLIEQSDHQVVNLDKLTYASTENSLHAAAASGRYQFIRADICDASAVENALDGVTAVMHLAAESHVDRSIDSPESFVRTNVIGTATLLQAARTRGIDRFHHVSTDEVYGSLSLDADPFTEESPYDPRSPYSASKAGSDHLVRAWAETYGMDVVITNCSNNYGPFQFPEKLIPLIVIRALSGESLPVYGRGENVRDWIFVEDHARALISVLEDGRRGETYNIGGSSERTNLEVVRLIADLLDELASPIDGGRSRSDLIEFVADRPGHDLRYAIDDRKIKSEIGWQPSLSFEEGLRRTVVWYLDNESWWAPLVQAQITARKGLG